MQSIIKYELVINEALRSALKYDDPDQQIQEFISFFGKHIGSDRIYIFEDNRKENTTDNTYEWCAESIAPEIDHLQGVDRSVIQWWYERFHEGKSVILEDVESIQESHPISYQMLKDQKVHNLVVCPIAYKDELQGFFGVDNPPKSDSLGLTTFLNMISTLLVSFLKMRNARNRSTRRATFSGYSALAQVYISMHYINVQTQQFHIIKTIPAVLQLFDRTSLDDAHYDVEEDFHSHIQKVFNAYCKEEYLENELTFLNLDTLEQRMRGKHSITSIFYGQVSGWCRDRFISVDTDEDGHLLHVLYCVECIDEQKKREDRLLYLAQTDRMTGIYNRGSGEYMIEQRLQRKEKGMLCLIDCNKFKSVNDTYGHAIGDEVLIAIADVLKRSCREQDIVLRLGGDEFAMFIPGVMNKETAEIVFRRVFSNMNTLKIKALGRRRITLSLGACFYDGTENVGFDQLYRKADMAMYQSKKQTDSSATIYGEN